jgi:hypothetical protein
MRYLLDPKKENVLLAIVVLIIVLAVCGIGAKLLGG